MIESINMLHIGFKVVCIDGRITIDIAPENNLESLNTVFAANARLPFEDDTIDFIFCDDLFEYFSWTDNQRLAKELIRILKPEGIMRVAMHDSDMTIDVNDSEILPTMKNNSSVNSDLFGNEFNTQYVGHDFHTLGHRYAYNYEDMACILKETGFTDLRKRLFQESTFEALRNLETRKESTLIIEASKVASPTPLVTIFCLVFNQEEFVRDALESFLFQRASFGYQVIVSDDSSTDKTTDILKEYERNHNNLKVIYRKKNLGAEMNFLYTIHDVRSKYVVYCDGDDYFTDQFKLQKQVDFLESNPEYSMCFHPVTVHYQDGSLSDSTYPPPERRFNKTEFTLNDLLKYNFMPTNSVMYRWRFINENILDSFPKSIFPGDHYLHLLHAQTGMIGFIDEVMSVYRKHSGGIWWDIQDTNKLYSRYFVELFSFYYEVYRNIAINKEKYYTDTLMPFFTKLMLAINDSEYLMKLSQLFEKYPLFAAEQFWLLYQKQEEEINSNQYPFPFSQVREGSKIVIYGGGIVGKIFLEQIKRSKYCECLFVIDRYHERIKRIADVEVREPEEIKKYEYDNVIIASQEFTDEMYQSLVRLGVPAEKIVMCEFPSNND